MTPAFLQTCFSFFLFSIFSICVFQIEIHQVMSLKDVYNPDNLKLIDMRRVGAYTHGWIIFTVVKAVNSWVNNTSPNYG